MQKNSRKNLILKCIALGIVCSFTPHVYALTGIVNVNDSLTLRSQPTTSSSVITRFYNATELTILNTNSGTGNGCGGNWYKSCPGKWLPSTITGPFSDKHISQATSFTSGTNLLASFTSLIILFHSGILKPINFVLVIG